MAGDNVALSVQDGSIGPAYQWVFNGTNAIAGATNSVLQLTNVQPAQSGAYAVIVTNDYGAVTSAPAILELMARGTTPVASCTEVALRAAMAGPGPVTFACDGTITLTNTLTISSNIVLDGSGHTITISGGNSVRLFTVSSNVTFSVLNLTIANGLAPDGQGGAILNAGGVLNATNCAFTGNLATNVSGGPAQGGAIFSANGQVALYHCTFTGNAASGGGGGDGCGGAVYSSGSLGAWLCAFIGNSATGGAGWLGISYPQGGPPLWPGPGGSALGGAICSLGQMTVAAITFASNSVTGGPGGGGAFIPPTGDAGGGFGAPGGPGNGGAIFNGGAATVSASTFAWNLATGGAGGPGGDGYSGGSGAYGGGGNSGALFSGGVARISNCTFASNTGAGGAGGGGGGGMSISGARVPTRDGNGGNGGPGVGAICDTNRLCFLTNCTLALNSASGGAGGAAGASFPPTYQGWAAGALQTAGATLVNTLLAGNAPSNCGGALTDAGHNLSSDASCAFTDPTSLNSTDPLLGPLVDNGGPTLTMALLPGSPAIGAADSASAPPTDQRRYPRPAGPADIGACEFGYPPILAAAQPPEGGVDISVSGRAGQTCRLLASPDLVSWTAIATNSFGPSGVFVLHDPAGAGQTQRFYRAVMP